MKNVLLILSIIFILTGCGNYYVKMYSQTAPDYYFDISKPIGIISPQPNTIENKKITHKLYMLLKEKGYKVRTDANVKYSFAISREFKTSLRQKTDKYATPIYRTEYIKMPSGRLMPHKVKVGEDIEYVTRDITNNYTLIKLTMFIYDKKNQSEKIWFIKALPEEEDIKRAEDKILKKLIELIGLEVDGEIIIKKDDP